MSWSRRWPRKRVTLALGVAAASLAAGAACSDTLQGTLALVTGPDDPFAENPKPTSLSVQLVGQEGGIQSSTAVQLPADGGLNLPSQTGTNIDSIRVTAYDDTKTAVALGQSLPLELDELSGVTLNLFIQRTGEFSRLPEAGIRTGSAPLLTTLFLRYLLVAESDGRDGATTPQIYDTLTWQTLPSPPSLPLAPRSLAYVNAWTGSDASVEGGATSISTLLTIGTKTAEWIDLTDSTSADAEVLIDASAPDGGSFADVSGGATVYNSTTGDVYVVGATRPKTPTATVLRISATGIMSFLFLNTPRAGAAATYLPGSSGLLVFGGATPKGDASAPADGVEFLSNDLPSGGHAAPCGPVDTITGAGAVPLGPTSTLVLLAGGVTATGVSGGVRVIDFSKCSGDASAFVTTWPAPRTGADGGGPEITFQQAQAFDIDANTAVVVGTEADGSVSAYELSKTGPAKLLPFRRPHTTSTAIVLPTGGLAVVGGSATMESFIP